MKQNSFGIAVAFDAYNTRLGFSIIEEGVRLPIIFKTLEGALAHVDLLKAGPQPTRDEILETVAEHIAKGGKS